MLTLKLFLQRNPYRGILTWPRLPGWEDFFKGSKVGEEMSKEAAEFVHDELLNQSGG